MFVGGSLEGEIKCIQPQDSAVLRVQVGDLVEFYHLEFDEALGGTHHKRGIATYYRSGESADSLIDFEMTS